MNGSRLGFYLHGWAMRDAVALYVVDLLMGRDALLLAGTNEEASELAAMVRAELVPRPGGLIQTHAAKVLEDALSMLEGIRSTSLFTALEAGTFGDVSRTIDGGRGADGIVTLREDYLNPFADIEVVSHA